MGLILISCCLLEVKIELYIRHCSGPGGNKEKRKMRRSIHGLIQQTDHSTSVPVGSLLLNVS